MNEIITTNVYIRFTDGVRMKIDGKLSIKDAGDVLIFESDKRATVVAKNQLMYYEYDTIAEIQRRAQENLRL